MSENALKDAAMLSLTKDILPRLQTRLKAVDAAAVATDPTILALNHEASELLRFIKNADAPAQSALNKPGAIVMPSSDHANEVADMPPSITDELEMSDDEALAMMNSTDPSPPRTDTSEAQEMSDEHARMLLSAMDEPAKAPAPPKGDMSDDEARMLLADMDEPVNTKSPANADMSDDEARMLLADMDEPVKTKSPANADMSDDEARMLLAAMDEPSTPAAAPKGTMSDKAARPPAVQPKSIAKAPPAMSAEEEARALLASLGGADDEDAPPPEPSSAAKAAAPSPAGAQAVPQTGDWEEIAEWRANDFQTDPDMVNDFITNCDELMVNLDDLVLQIESAPDNKDIIEGIFRAAHTLKGAAGMFGFSAMERVMHRMETLFDLVRKGKLRPTSDIIDLLFRGLDIIKPLLKAVKDGKPCGIKTGPVVRSLTLAGQGIFEKPQGDAASPAAIPAEKAAGGSGGGNPPSQRPAGAEKASGSDKKDEQTTIRVDLSRLDTLVNLIGELVIDRTRFVTIEEELRTNHPAVKLSGNIAETVQLFGRHMNEIQDIIMKVRMVPIGNAFNKFSRIIRDLSKQLGKKIDLVITGESAELDKTLVEQIGDPLIHLIRNSCDHGIEMPEDRQKNGKNPTGRIALGARQEGTHIVITVEDDGKGIPTDIIRRKGIEKGLITEDQQLTERDILNLIFEPGFSTADKVTNVSGRGVGMDVVKKQVNKLKGVINISSVLGRGTTMTIRLPLTLAIVQSLLVGSRGEIFAIPLSSVIESIRIQPSEIQKVGEREVIKLRDQVLPLMHLAETINLSSRGDNISEMLKLSKLASEAPSSRRQRTTNRAFVVVVGHADRPFGLVVDQLLNQQEMVIKSMGPLMQKIPCVAGGAVLGNGEVVLVLDVPELENSFRTKQRTPGQVAA